MENNKVYILCAALVMASTAMVAAQSSVDSYTASSFVEAKSASRAVVDGETLRKSTAVNLTDALIGQLPGLIVMQGESGNNIFDNEATLYFRGVGTSGDNSILTLVDGVERTLSTISLAEVERVELITDAVSLAMYGIRGANGALLVTTKRGGADRSINARYSLGYDFAFRSPEFVDAASYATLLNEALANDGLDARYTSKEIEYFKSGEYAELYPDVDWQDEIYNNCGVTHQGSVDYSGGGENFNCFTVLDYANQQAMFAPTALNSTYNSQAKRLSLNLRTNVDMKVTKSTTASLNLLGQIQEDYRTSASLSSVFSAIYDTPAAAFPVKTSSGMWGGDGYHTNAVAELGDVGYTRNYQRSLIGDLTLNQDFSSITKGLGARVTVAYDNMANYYETRSKSYQYEINSLFVDENSNPAILSTITGGVSDDLAYSTSLTNQYMATSVLAAATYDRTFGKHRVGGELMYDLYGYVGKGQNSSRKTQSVTARASYGYDDRYMVDVAMSYSGSSVLSSGTYLQLYPTVEYTTGKNEQYHLYPAVSAAWNVINESFMEGVKAVTNLRLSGSYGISGSALFDHDLDEFLIVSSNIYWFTDSFTYNQGRALKYLPVEELLPERSEKYNISLDLGLWNKLNLSATYFLENRSNILVEQTSTISDVLGVEPDMLCIGEVQNKGVEASMSWRDRIGGADSPWGYAVSGVFTFAKNTIVNCNEGQKYSDNLYTTGNSVGQLYGLTSDGFFDSWEEIADAPTHTLSQVQPGDVKYVDINGDDKIDANDVSAIGYGEVPQIYYGFNLNLNYANFGVTAYFQGVGRRSVMLQTSSLFIPLQNNTNISTWYTEENVRWTEATADTANLPRLSTLENENNNYASDIWMRSGNYLKLRNLEVYYNIPRRVLGDVANARVWINGSNLFSIDKIKYADPEMLSANYPSMRSVTVGIDLSF